MHVDPARAASLLKRRYEPARQELLAACGLDLAAPAVLEMQRVLDTYMARSRGQTSGDAVQMRRDAT
ncbi:hypothetical protein [Mycobacterium servetii]|uniref:Uncharacterized protein n=1 Tax=Mycobacterium servetii TaxID=3237418 RepID=A0ABV4C8V1_9MYCO